MAQQAQPPAAPGGWVPTPQGLRQMVVLFGDPDPSLTPAQQQALYQQLGQLQTDPQYIAYLAYIVLHLHRHAGDVATWLPYGTSLDDLRARAGLELKNRVKDRELWTRTEPAMRAFVKETALSCLVDSKNIMHIVGANIVTTVAKGDGLQNWPGLLQHLVGLLDTAQPDAMDGGFSALCMICEDMPRELDSDELQRPLNFLIPKLLSFFQHPEKTVRKHAISTVNVFLKPKPNALLVNIGSYLENLFVLAGKDATPEIRRRVCNAFVLLLDPRLFPSLQAHIEKVIQFMLAASNDADESVQLGAMEFWSAYCRSGPAFNKALLEKYLVHLVPTLLKAMCYSEDELAAMGEDDEDDQAVPDRPEDTRPFHKKDKEADMAGNDEEEDGAGGDDEEDEEEADWLDEDEVTAWTVRKCSADALDKLSGVFRGDLLPHLLPKLQAALNSKGATPAEERQAWVVRESAVLALGAVAEGCMSALRPYLPQLLPFLVTNFLKDSKPLVRSITCWTLSRYIRWVIDETVTTHQQQHGPLFAPLLKALLEHVLDKNKKVQEAACSAMATLEEEARIMLVPYLPDILRTLMRAYVTYQAHNLLVLYDTISTLCDAVHQHLRSPELISILMPPLMHKWSTLSHDDFNLLPLFECLTAVAQALGPVFLPFAEPVFGRCLYVIESTLKAQIEAERILQAGGDADLPEKDFVVCAIDLWSGLAEGLGDSMEALVGAQANRALGALYECAKDLNPDVRQSAFALLGDLAKTCMGHIRPHLPLFVPLATRNLNPLFYYVCNNASWAIGMMAIKAGGADMLPFVDEVLTYLSPILTKGDPAMQLTVLENAAVTVGRLAFICAPQVAAHLEEIAVKWLTYLAPLKEDQEKEHAFRGMLAAVQINPQAIYKANAFPQLISAIAAWQQPQPELAQLFHALLMQFKQQLGAQWEPIMATCDPDARAFILRGYKV